MVASLAQLVEDWDNHTEAVRSKLLRLTSVLDDKVRSPVDEALMKLIDKGDAQTRADIIVQIATGSRNATFHEPLRKAVMKFVNQVPSTEAGAISPQAWMTAVSALVCVDSGLRKSWPRLLEIIAEDCKNPKPVFAFSLGERRTVGGSFSRRLCLAGCLCRVTKGGEHTGAIADRLKKHAGEKPDYSRVARSWDSLMSAIYQGDRIAQPVVAGNADTESTVFRLLVRLALKSMLPHDDYRQIMSEIGETP